MAARSAQAAPKPVSQARQYSQRMAAEQSTRTFVLLGIALVIIVPRLPSPIGPFPITDFWVLGPWDWKGYLWELAAPMLLFPIPPEGFGIPSVPLLQILYWLAALMGVFFIGTLFQHLSSLYAQRVRPLTAKHTYLRLMVPSDTKMTPVDGITLLRTFHGMLPPANLMMGTPVPLVLRWSGRAEEPVEQGVTVCGQPTLVTSIQKTLEGLGGGTRADANDDPFLAALKPGRYLCYADVRLTAPSDLPIAVAEKGRDPLIDALLPAMAPQSGVVISDVQIMLRPVGDRTWRLPVLARLESLKVDSAAAERRVMEAKAAGPAFQIHMRLRAISERPESGQAMVQTMAATLSSSAQAVANAQQRLSAGGVQVLPAVVDPRPPFPALLRTVGIALGVILMLASAVGLWVFKAPLLLWVWAPLLLPLPFLGLAAFHRKRVNAELPQAYQAVVNSVMPPVNPKIVPLIGDWLRKD